VLTVMMMRLPRRSASGDFMLVWTLALLFALFGILMPKGEKRSSRTHGICMVVVPFASPFVCFHCSLNSLVSSC
jgi:hypothetical protein